MRTIEIRYLILFLNVLLVFQWSRVEHCVDVVDLAGRDWLASSLVSWESSVRMQKGFPRRKQAQGVDFTHQPFMIFISIIMLE